MTVNNKGNSAPAVMQLQLLIYLLSYDGSLR